MSEILHDTSTQAIVAPMESNFTEEMATFGRYFPGATLYEDQELLWFTTGLPYGMFNAVLHTHLTAERVDAKIDEILGYFQAHQLPVSWIIRPSTQPANLGTYLEAHGFTHIMDKSGMAADLSALNEDIPAPPDLRIEEIRNEEMLKQLLIIESQGFGSPEAVSKVYYDTYVNIGLSKDLPWQHYLGLLNDEPVAISSLLLHAGVAGIYGVATIPEARRQGIGAAMTLAPLREARRRGYRIGILSPSEMGRGVYERIGFWECYKQSIYGWEP